jgi:hypothetical protein
MNNFAIFYFGTSKKNQKTQISAPGRQNLQKDSMTGSRKGIILYEASPMYVFWKKPDTALYSKYISSLCRPWMKEEKGIRHRVEGAYLCCPVFTTVHFSLRNEGSSEYI